MSKRKLVVADSNRTPGEIARDYVNRALIYERAISRLSAMRTLLYTEKRKRYLFREADDREDDASIDIALARLDAEIADLEKQCDKWWQLVKENAVADEKNIIMLYNAVVLQAVHDYEGAISKSGKRSDEIIDEVQEFADSGQSLHYADINLDSVLARVRREYPKFKQIAEKNCKEIKVETEEIKRKSKSVKYDKAKYRCPLCGSGLYLYGKPQSGIHDIRCSGCRLEAWVYCEQ